MAAKKQPMVTVVMPVGVDAGKKVKVPKDQAERIRRDFGEWNAITSKSASGTTVADLEKFLMDETRRADVAEAKITELEALLESATDDSDENGAQQ